LLQTVLQSLTAEIIAGGLVGFIMLGVVIRNVLIGWREATNNSKGGNSHAMTTALSVSWDRDQIDRALEYLETIAKSQSVLADRFQHTTHSRLDELMDKLDHIENVPQRPRPRR
jgi:hypothetical protein